MNFSYSINPEIPVDKPKIGVDSTRKKHTEIVMDSHTNFIHKKMCENATGINLDGTTYTKGNKPKIENYRAVVYDSNSSVNLISVGKPHFYEKKVNSDTICAAAEVEFHNLGALANCTTAICDGAGDGMAGIGKLIASSKVLTNLVGQACGPAHNVHNVALFVGGKVLGQAAPWFPKKAGKESMKIGNKNVNMASTLCNDLGDN